MLVAWVLWEVLRPAATVVQACRPVSQDQVWVVRVAARVQAQRGLLPEQTAVAHRVLSTVRLILAAVLRVAVSRWMVAAVAAVS